MIDKSKEDLAKEVKLLHKQIKELEAVNSGYKQTEKALRESEKKFSSIFDSMLEGFALHEIVCDGKGKPVDYRFLDMNPAFGKLTGLKKEDIIGKTVLTVMPDTEPFWIEEYGKVALTGKPADFEHYSCALKRYYHVVAFCPQKNKFAVIFSDTTKRKQIEEELRESERFLGSIIENIPDMVFVKKAKDLTFVKFNKAGEELLGYTQESMIGKSDRDFFPKDEADFFIAEDRSVFKGKRVREIPEEKIKTKDKGERILHTKKIPLLDDQGKPLYLLGISEDITERKLAEAQIIQSEKMAGIGRLAASITHELRNPLMYITANIGLMEQYFQRIAGEVVELEKITQNVPPESQEKLAALKDSFLKIYKEIEQSVKDSREGCARINDIVGGLLDYARLGSDLTEPVDLNVVVDKALELVGSDIRYKCKVEKDFQKLPVIFGNQRELEQVFVNLFVNASQAIKKDGLLKVKSYLDGREAVVEVCDNGSGIAPENLNKIFEPFFTTKKDGEGAGLGLAIAHRIIGRHGGSIAAESGVNKGATFIIRLPVKPNYTRV